MISMVLNESLRLLMKAGIFIAKIITNAMSVIRTGVSHLDFSCILANLLYFFLSNMILKYSLKQCVSIYNHAVAEVK